MANLEFCAGIGKVSGTLSKTTIRTSKGTVTRRVLACVRNGKQKLYIREDNPRRTKPSAKETTQRQTFALMASEVSRRMANGDKRPRKIIWAEVKAELKKGGNDAQA